MHHNKKIPKIASGFTIVELLIVIVVIAILATISIVAFNGIQARAEESKLKSNLGQAAKQIEIFEAESGELPYSQDQVDSGKGLTTGDNVKFEYTRMGDNYCLSATSITRAVRGFHVQRGGKISEGVCIGHVDPVEGSPPTTTVTSCFNTDPSTGRIRAYYTHQNNNPSEPACPFEVVIPNTINGRTVTQIGGYLGDAAFKDSPVTSVLIPDTVTLIGAGAFSGSSLTSVTIPNSVTTINSRAFSNSKLTSIAIPDSVKTIGTRAFENNQLVSVALPTSLVTISELAFHGNKLTAVSIPDSVKTIERSAFYNNQISSLQLGSSIEEVNASAFSDNKLTVITIPPSVTTLGSSSFRNNLITSVYIPNAVVELGSWAFAGNPLASASIPPGLTLPPPSSSSFPASTTVTRR